MKTSSLSWIAVSTLLAVCLFATAGRGASLVTIPLSGTVIRSGSNTVVSATGAIDPADIYYYQVSGTCHGTGNLQGAIPAGTNFATALATVDPALVPYLQGTLLDVKAGFPLTLANKTATGSVPSLRLRGTIHLKAGIDKNGICTCALTNISFRVGPFTDKTDTLVLDSGQCVVQVSPFAGDAQPDLSFRETDGKLFGQARFSANGAGESSPTVPVLATRAHYTFPVVLQNYSSHSDSFTLSSLAPGTGFVQKFIYKGKDITAEVAAGTFKTGVLKPGATTTLSWEMINMSAPSQSNDLNGGLLPRLTATSVLDTSKVDALTYFAESQ